MHNKDGLDVNDNFRWATGHIAAVRRTYVEGVNVYNLLKFRYLVITEPALKKLTKFLRFYPEKQSWGPTCATPDGKPAPVPEKVPGWNADWVAWKQRLKNSEFRERLLAAERKKWRWSTELKGPLKVKRNDPLAKFRLTDFGKLDLSDPWEQLEDLYADDEPIGMGVEEEEDAA